MPVTQKHFPKPKPYFLSKEYEENTSTDPAVVRGLAPFQVGDIIYVERFRKVKMAKVIAVELAYVGSTMKLTALYRVAIMLVDGTFHALKPGRGVIRVSLNDIFNGYKRAGQCPQEYLTER